MAKQELRDHTCCFTGHRPEKLTKPENEIITRLKEEISRAINDGFTFFISGMARGVDIWAAEIVLKMRDIGSPVHLICACPFDGFERSWDEKWRKRYAEVIMKADRVEYICPGYNRGCFQIRNKWMVDRSARVIAVFNGEKGGTKNTIEYAERTGVKVEII